MFGRDQMDQLDSEKRSEDGESAKGRKMLDSSTFIALSASGLVAAALASGAALRGWSGWLALKRLEIAARRDGRVSGTAPVWKSDLGELRERVRRLEAIASGTEL